MDTCASMLGVILATPESFTIHFVQVLDAPVMSIESFLDYLSIWIGVPVDLSAADTVVAGRPRCVVPTLLQEAPR